MKNNNGWEGRNLVHRKGIFGQEIEVYNANTPEGNSAYNNATNKWLGKVTLTVVGILMSGIAFIVI